ncbi:DNA/RNA polymerase [Dentipellis sp. KUC8613]|nr:DNA/RNA polymerase [Dentipellis sp. KUC8613]
MSNASPTRPSIWKGKAKATPASDFEDLNPPITYRHLLSPPPGARDPLRTIALCDADAFYAACEQLRLDVDPARPLVVRQWESLIAVNYPARKFGITRMMKADEALKKCPELVVVHVATFKDGDSEPGYWDKPNVATHKVSLDYYRRESGKVIDIFKSGLPTGEIEKASIDEAFIDLTIPVREKILERYPHLAKVPPDAPNGIDTLLPPPPPISWKDRGLLIPIDPTDDVTTATTGTADAAGSSESLNDDDAVKDGQDAVTWHDVALSIAAELMQKIRDDVRTQLGYTTSAGIARNKFLAKLAASYKKYDSQSILRNAAIPNYLKPMPFQKIRFLGGKLGKALAEEYDVSTVGDLLTISLDEIQRKFGEEAIWVYEILRGIDRSEVKEKPALTKSMMAAKNLPRPITKVSEGPHWLRVLAAELAHRLNEMRLTQSVWPRTLGLHVRRGYDDGRSRQGPFPFVKDLTVDVIATAGDRLWKELMGDRKSPFKVTHVALVFTGLEAVENGQQSIDGFFQTRAGSVKPRSSGGGASPSKKRKTSASAASAGADRPLSAGGADRLTPGPSGKPTVSGRDEDQSTSFTCPRCRKHIQLPSAQLAAMAADGTDDRQRGRWLETELARLRMEHDDFHLAQDLSLSDGHGTGQGGLRVQSAPSNSKPSSKQKKRKKTAKSPEGIAKFFTKP